LNFDAGFLWKQPFQWRIDADESPEKRFIEEKS